MTTFYPIGIDAENQVYQMDKVKCGYDSDENVPFFRQTLALVSENEQSILLEAWKFWSFGDDHKITNNRNMFFG